MKITAVLLHYWKERSNNFRKIIEDMETCTRPPDRIIVFDQSEKEYERIGDEIVIRSDKHFGCRARHIVALLEPSDYYLFADDDLVVDQQCIELFEKYAHPDQVIGLFGKNADGSIVFSRDIDRPTKVDFIIGRIHFTSPKCIVNSLNCRIENKLMKQMLYGDDVILGMSNKSIVLPRGKGYIEELSTSGVGAVERPLHKQKRAEIANKLIINKLKICPK